MAEGGPRIWTPGGEQPLRGPEPQQPQAEEPTPEQLIEQIRKVRVADLLVSTMSTLAQLAYVKLDPSSLDLDDARLAIDALRALLPVVDGTAPAELVRDFHQVIANLQLAYADAAAAAPKGEDPEVSAPES